MAAHIHRRVNGWIAACLALVGSGRSMASEIRLQWEWTAGRSLSDRLVVRVTDVAATSQGPVDSPSLARNLPEPTRVQGTVAAPDTAKGRALSLVLPKLELHGITVGERMALGLVDKSTAVCVQAVPASVADADLPEWLSSFTCPS